MEVKNKGTGAGGANTNANEVVRCELRSKRCEKI